MNAMNATELPSAPDAASSTPIFHLANVRKSYRTPEGSELVILDGVDLDLRDGEILVLLGRSGSGKSTLLRCMNGLVRPDGGSLSLGGIDLLRRHSRRELARQVAMVFQHHNLVPRLSVRKNVLTGRLGQLGTLASIAQFFRAGDLALAEECLARVGLAHKADARTDSLSGGQMQRVGIARAGPAAAGDPGRRARGQP